MLTRTAEQKRNRSKATDYLPVKSERKVVLLKVEDIDWVESTDNHVTLRVGKQSYLVRGTLDSIELRLPTNKFVRISRFNIVQIDRIKEFKPLPFGDCRVTLHSGSNLTLSRRYRGNLQKRGLL